MIFNKGEAKGHFLGGNSLRMSNIYMSEICKICEKFLDDGTIVLVAKQNEATIVICSECAYAIHLGYEANL